MVYPMDIKMQRWLTGGSAWFTGFYWFFHGTLKSCFVIWEHGDEKSPAHMGPFNPVK